MRPLFALVFIVLMSGSASTAEYYVYYLGGQSNMDGYGHNKQLPDELKEGVSGVYIFHGNTSKDGAPVDGRGLWAPLKAGHGVGFKSDGQQNKPSNRFGVEMTFAQHIQRSNPNRKVALIKYSRGGTSIAREAAGGFGCWEPDYDGGQGAGKGINQYDHFLATIKNATEGQDVDGDGQRDKLIPAGILWMQGESDAAHGKEIAERYQANLKRLVDLIRAALREDDLPVVIGRISDSGRDDKDGKVWDHGDVVRQAQADYVAEDPSAALVTSTDEYDYSDPWHYDSAGYIDLGQQFAKRMLELEENRALD